jgi:hypothetical protein
VFFFISNWPPAIRLLILCRLVPGPLAGDLLYLCLVSVLVMVKLTSLLSSQPLEPYWPLEAAVHLLTGGLWD